MVERRVDVATQAEGAGQLHRDETVRERSDQTGRLQGTLGSDHPLGEVEHGCGGWHEPVERASRSVREVHEEDPVDAWLGVGEVTERRCHGPHPSGGVRVVSYCQ
jgi:hypothetical protein